MRTAPTAQRGGRRTLVPVALPLVPLLLLAAIIATELTTRAGIWLATLPTQRPAAVVPRDPPPPDVNAGARVVVNRNLFASRPPQPERLAVGASRNGVTRMGPNTWAIEPPPRGPMSTECHPKQARVAQVGGGWVISDIRPGSIFDLAGFQDGDRLEALDGQPPSPNDLVSVLDRLMLQGAVAWSIDRPGGRVEVHWQLAERAQ